jgi:hypothetical protein
MNQLVVVQQPLQPTDLDKSNSFGFSQIVCMHSKLAFLAKAKSLIPDFPLTEVNGNEVLWILNSKK